MDSNDDSNERGEHDTDNRVSPNVTPEQLAALEDEREIHGETEAEMAKRLFKQELVASAYSITHLAKYANNEKLRYEASRYVVERNLGRLQDATTDEETDPWTNLMASCVMSTDEDEAVSKAAEVLTKTTHDQAEALRRIAPDDSISGEDAK